MEQGHETTEGAPAEGAGRPARRTVGRLRRGLLAALVAAAVAVPLAGATRPQVPAPAPTELPPPTAVTLDAAYAAHRADAAEAARTADRHGYGDRATAERGLSQRKLLAFDGRGAGLVTEVLGDLAHADRVAVLVPGSDTGIDTYERFRDTALALHERLTRQAPAGVRTAVVAWLGYETPGTLSPAVTTTGRAEDAAPELRRLIDDVRSVAGPRVRLSLLCHSYGSVVCARAASGLGVDDLVFLGSPGTGADTAADLRTRARVWAARGAGDWVEHVPHIDAELFGTTVGFGTDPVSREFGARVFAAGDGGHSDYYAPGSLSLANLTRIVLGHTQEVTR
ncbi:alpha/beta hydrolase [Streptomyces sp. PAL114]|uniref:alpha/beta hydrolase n=1 Tax=Streptomyces sp. PAL114 TaxID=2970893 RepID=UPI0028FD8FD8|nr:alpha/beta hydrolase [Streptomyces sp. PAL114]MDU0304815.1 alpha/beta hydrolase [Streptomyces sp. PAL114]